MEMPIFMKKRNLSRAPFSPSVCECVLDLGLFT